MEKIVGIYQQLDHDEILEVNNPAVSFVHFEKGSVFKSDDTCLGKIYLTSKKILILKLIVLEAKKHDNKIRGAGRLIYGPVV